MSSSAEEMKRKQEAIKAYYEDKWDKCAPRVKNSPSPTYIQYPIEKEWELLKAEKVGDRILKYKGKK